MKWSDNWSEDRKPSDVSTERDTGFEPATSSLGSWCALREGLKNKARDAVTVVKAGPNPTQIGQRVVREVVRGSALARRFREGAVPLVWPHPPPGLFVPEPPDSNEDLLEPLRRKACS